MTKIYKPIAFIAIILFFQLSFLGWAGANTTQVENEAIVEGNYDVVQASISQIEALPKTEGVEIILHANQAINYKTFRFDNPPRIAIDLNHCKLAKGASLLQVNLGIVKMVKSKEFRNEKNTLSRVEVILNEKEKSEVKISRKGNNLSLFIPSDGVNVSAAPAEKVFSHLEASTTMNSPRIHSVSQNDVPFIRIAQANTTASKVIEHTIGSADNAYAEQAEKQYKGIPISLDLKDADVIDIFLTISELTNYNIIVDPKIHAKINIRMHDVPWDQALDIILKQLSLGKAFTGTKSPEFPKGNIIRITTMGKLKAEANARRALMEARKIAEPLFTKIFYLSYANAAELKMKVKKLLTSRGQIIVDKRTNALIVTDVTPSLNKVKNMISLLDVRTKQVLISSQIITTKKDFSRDLGIQWGGKFTADSVHGNTTGFRFPNNYSVDGSSNGGYAVNLPAGSPIVGLSLGNVLNTMQLNFVLSAGETEGLTKVISSPRIMTSDNISAEIKTGTQIAYTVFSDRGLEVQFKDAVISLKVTPHITNDNFIKMKIDAKKDSPDFSVTPPAINTNNAKTQVLVRDGDTIVIGGLNQSTEGWHEERIPFFHKIPFLGWLFKSHGIKNEYDDLLVFISPKIMQQEKSNVQAIVFDQTLNNKKEASK